MAYLIGIVILFCIYAAGGGWVLLGTLAILGLTATAQVRWEKSQPPKGMFQ